MAEPAITWESTFENGGEPARHLVLDCTYSIELACNDMLAGILARDVSDAFEGDASTRRLRNYAVRIKQLNSVLMSYLDQDTVTLRDAHREMYGVPPAEGSEP